MDKIGRFKDACRDLTTAESERRQEEAAKRSEDKRKTDEA